MNIQFDKKIGSARPPLFHSLSLLAKGWRGKRHVLVWYYFLSSWFTVVIVCTDTRSKLTCTNGSRDNQMRVKKRRTNDRSVRQWGRTYVVESKSSSRQGVPEFLPFFYAIWGGVEGDSVRHARAGNSSSSFVRVNECKSKKRKKNKNILRPTWGSNPRPWD